MALRTLKILRVAANLTQDQLANKMGVDQTTISLYESEDYPVPQGKREQFVGLCSPRIDWNKLRSLKSAVLS